MKETKSNKVIIAVSANSGWARRLGSNTSKGLYPLLFLTTSISLILVLINSLDTSHLETIVATHSASLLSHIFRFEVHLQGRELILPWTSVYIDRRCTAIEAMVVFSALILSTREKPLRKALAISMNLILIYWGNVLRIVLILYLTKWTPLWVAHDLIGKAISVLGVMTFSYLTFRLFPRIEEDVFSLVDFLAHLPSRLGHHRSNESR